MKPLMFLALAAISSHVDGQTLAKFTDITWGPFTEGMNYTIGWSEGNGATVSANLWSGNYSQPIFADLPSNSTYVYTIPPVAEGSYSMRLLQGGVQADESPIFTIYAAAPASNSNASFTVDTAAASTSYAAAASSTNLTAAHCTDTAAEAGMTTYIYYDEVCGCNKTALTPGPTAVPGWEGNMNYTAPAMTTPAGDATATPSTIGGGRPAEYEGGASSLDELNLMAFVLAFILVGLFV